MDTSTASSVSTQPAPFDRFGNHPSSPEPVSENPAVVHQPGGTGSATTPGIRSIPDSESSLSSAYRPAIVTSFELATLPSLFARHSGEPECMAAIERMRAIYTDPGFSRAHAAGECGCDFLDVMFMHSELERLPDVLLACDGRREDMQMQMQMEGMEMDEEERECAEIRRRIAKEIRRAARLERRTEELKRRRIPKFQPDPALVAWMQSVDEEMARRFGLSLPRGLGSGVSSMPVAGNDTAKEDVSL
ncbi:hypothetical protein V8D89_004643 [Ganoderma adspersum]